VLEQIDSKAVWSSVGKALGAELRDHNVIRGTSGLDHKVEAIAVDDKNGRVIVVSAEPNPRTAAMMQVDIQTTMPDAKVLLVRPIAFGIDSIARQLMTEIGKAEINFSEIMSKAEALKSQDGSTAAVPAFDRTMESAFGVLKRMNLPPLHQWMSAIQQLSLIDWETTFRDVKDPAGIILPFANLITLDLMAFDREVGICPVPLYDLSDQDWATLHSGKDPDEVVDCLRRHGVFQFFFPPADQLALAIADRNSGTENAIISAVNLAPELGHPFGDLELLPKGVSITDLIDALTEQGLVVEGELGMEVTQTGTAARATVKFKPREGVVSKLLNKLGLTVNVGISP
jgi:hypothetical protein